MKYVLGIDLGTTNCSVTAIDENGRTTVIKNSDGEYITPSAVWFSPEPNTFIVGKRAKSRSSDGDGRLVTLVKREMGRKKEEVRYDKTDREFHPYSFWGRVFSPEEISSKILLQLRRDVEKELGQDVRDAVITCPGYFGQNEKEATRLAGELAGLNVIEVIPEPTAAALSYSTVFDGKSGRVFVFDLGGGTFDITILELKNDQNGGISIETERCGGDPKLGGADWDAFLLDYVISRFDQKFHFDLAFATGPEQERAYGKLKLDVERAKKELSNAQETTISLEYGGQRLEERITRQKYAEITQQLTDRLRSYCQKLLSEASISWSNIDTILMVGSMSNCPSVQDALREWSGKDVAFNVVNPKTCVSEGAAIRAYTKLCEREGRSAVVSSLAKKPNYESAEGGSAIAESVASSEQNGERTQTRIVSATSVLPSSICLKLRNAKTGQPWAFKMLKKNGTYPCEFVRDFPIGRDGLPEVSLVVLEGESDNPSFCAELGNAILPLDGNHSKEDRVRVTFRADENGIIQVAGLDLKTNRSVAAEIRRANTLSKEEIERAKKQAEEDEFVLA